MKVKVATASDIVLDWLVAKAEGHDVVVLTVEEQALRWMEYVDADKRTKEEEDFNTYIRPTLKPVICLRGDDGYKRRPTHQEAPMLWGEGLPEFKYSRSHTQGGPIIERFGMCLLAFGLGATGWSASMPSGPTASLRVYGPTPLIAAMRCYVTSKLGEEVDVPKELLK